MRKLKYLFFLIVFGGLAAAGAGGYVFYLPNTTPKVMPYDFLIPRGAGYNWVVEQLRADEVIKDFQTFKLTAALLKYPELVKPGKYTLRKGMGNLELVRKLRSGDQDPIELRFGAHYQKSALANEIAAQMGFEGKELLALLMDEEFLREFDQSPSTVASLFIPDTYFVYYTLSPEEVVRRMHSEYKNFWNNDRIAKAKKLAFSKNEVVTLASIVQAESYMADERPVIAGVYLNRLKKGMKLQADPTVIFANNDFSIRRVLKKHLKKDSPYNTYKYKGLPPGPINNPEVSAIDAVLNYKQHEYIFFCAKADFSGYHSFSRTLSQHNRYAREYHRALNALKKKKSGS